MQFSEGTTMHPAIGRRSLRRAAFVMVCAFLAQGCSLVFVRPPRSDATDEPPRCTESRAAPVVDSVVASAALLFGFAGLGATLGCSPHCGENAGPAVAILGALVLLPTGASAVHGFRATNRCREAMTSWCAAHDCGEPDAPR